MNFALTLPDLHRAMAACEQAPGLNMIQHGQMVHDRYRWLLDQIQAGQAPHPILEAAAQVHLTWAPAEAVERYHLYHDCGKPLVMTTGPDGQRRFPGHADASAQQYALLFPDDRLTRHLIHRDMDFHTLRGDDLIALCHDPSAPTLYLTAWAEVYANASLFGGAHSDSFKIKAKRLVQAGKKLLTLTPQPEIAHEA